MRSLGNRDRRESQWISRSLGEGVKEGSSPHLGASYHAALRRDGSDGAPPAQETLAQRADLAVRADSGALCKTRLITSQVEVRRREPPLPMPLFSAVPNPRASCAAIEWPRKCAGLLQTPMVCR